MKRLITIAALALCTAIPLIAQAPKGWMVRADRSTSASDPDGAGAIKFMQMGKGFHAINPAAAVYWNPANTAAGNYTVSATFTESNYMGLNDHPHPYGIVIGGTDLGSPTQSFLYCSAYGNGTFIVRGMGPAPFAVSARKPEPNASINKAAGKGSPVKQDIALSVTGDKIECSVNGTVVGSYPKADVVAAGKLKSTDGVYGIRFAHNTEASVKGLTMTKQ